MAEATPVCNTGVTLIRPAAVTLDWLSATSDTSPERLRAVVGSLVAAKVARFGERECRPSQAYAHAVEWVKDDKRVAVVQWGGVNHALPHVTVPGTGGLSGFVRQELALTDSYGFSSKASRVDVALDFRGVPFDYLSKLCGDEPSRMVTNADADKGDTHYFGSRTSRHFVRVYEKGKQQGDGVSPDWVRVEVEVKPDTRDGKFLAMKAKLPDLVRTGQIGRRFAEAIDLDGERLNLSAPEKNNHGLAKRLRYMRKQYGPTLHELATVCGEDVDLFLEALFYPMSEELLERISGVSA